MKAVKIILAIMSLVCLLDMPYGYYQLYRFAAMVGFFYLAYQEQNRKFWFIIWVISGLLVQPFFKISLGRELWNVVDVIWVILLILSIFKFDKTIKMKDIAKVLVFLGIGFLFQMVVVFIALQIEGDIVGAGKGTYAIPYILSYVLAWRIVYKKKFPNFLFKNETNEIKEVPVDKKVVFDKKADENIRLTNQTHTDSNESIPNWVLTISVVLLVAFAALIINYIQPYSTIISKETIKKENPKETNSSLSKLVSVALNTPLQKSIVRGKDVYGKYSQVILNSEKIIENFPDYPEGYAIKGYLLVRMDGYTDYASAVYNLTKAIDLGYEFSYDLYYWRGIAKIELGDKRGGRLDFDKHIEELGKRDSTAWNLYKLARTYFFYGYAGRFNSRAKYYIKAYKLLTKTIEEYNKNGVGYVSVSRSYFGDSARKLMPQAVPLKFQFDDLDFMGIVYRRKVSTWDDLYEYRVYYKEISELLNNDFCPLMSKAGEQGYSLVYPYIKKYCR